MKRLLKNLILKLIEYIESIEYKNVDLSNKIIETLDISSEPLLIESDSGFVEVTHLHKTKPYRVYEIETRNGLKLSGADEHIVFDECMNQIFIKDLVIGSFIWTKCGISPIVRISCLPFSVSMYDVSVNNNDHRLYTNDILSHNTVVSAIFITWYICTNYDRNVLIVANKSATMKEILSKIKNVYENLPFFLKPGVIEYNKEGMIFDNGCRIFGQATSETPALGFTVHLLYADEFAHIPEHIVEAFYRSIFPTLSSSQISRIIITSTPNGTNKFYQLYTGALKKENSYKALRTDWWEVPGRDDKWKESEINNLGSLELFNQEYGNQFLTADKLLLDMSTFRRLEHIKKTYVEKYISDFDDRGLSSKNMLWRSDMNFNFNLNKDRFVFSIDLADGVGGDYSIINIFKVVPVSIAKIKSSKYHKKDSDFFRLVQVGFFRSNTESINEVSKVLNSLIFDVFNPEICKIVLEVNHKGEYIIDKLSENKDFFIELLIHTKHASSHDYLSPGVKLNNKNKPFLCRELAEKMKNTKIVVDNDINIIEAQSFGIDEKGSYNSQIGHDDMMMTCVNMLCIFDNSMFDEIVEEIYDFQDDNIKKLIAKKMSGIIDTDDELDYEFLRNLNN